MAAALILLAAGSGTEIRNTADDCIGFAERVYGDTRPEDPEMAAFASVETGGEAGEEHLILFCPEP